jgi:1-deoxyxylulose-5-phosphate synthase
VEDRPLGRAGARVSVVGIGANQIGTRVDQAAAAQILDAAVDLGVNFIDTADAYGKGLSEEFLGEALKGRRQEFVVATKTGATYEPIGRLSRRTIVSRVEQSLRRLDTEYIDLYYLHFPDPGTDLEESLRALDDLVRAGKILYPAISNHPAWQVAEALATCDRRGFAPPVVSQNPYSLLERDVERELLPALSHFELSVVPYSPLAGGFLTGKYRRDQPPPLGVRGHENERFQKAWLREENFAALTRYEAFAREHGREVGELAVAWLLAHRQVCSVIAGVTSAEQLRQNVRAAEWTLESADLELLDHGGV